MKRGDVITIAVSGDYGKPRPAIVIQSDNLNQGDSVLVALLTSTLIEAPYYRVSLDPDEQHGLRAQSQVMVDKILAVPRSKCGPVIGSIGETALAALNQMLVVMIGLAD